eukprot:m.53166 g.53166  ORF g.53166 m.53166 type:complete len:316 (+) comp12356_c0_seq2:337-1284(+)
MQPHVSERTRSPLLSSGWSVLFLLIMFLASDNTLPATGATSLPSYLWDCLAPYHQPQRWLTSAPHETPYVYFVHLRKSGGSTVEYMLLREAQLTQYMVDVKRRGAERPEPGKFHIFRWFQSNQLGKIGHYNKSQNHHLNRRDKFRPYVYFTVLRHPVSRVVSFYWFCHRFWRYKDIVLHPNGTSKLSLTEFVEQGHALNDHQYWATRSDGDDGVADAKRTLSTQYLVVGVVERFNETMVALQAALGLDTHYEHRNTGHYPAHASLSITDLERATILKHNQRDLALWEHANTLLDRQIECHGKERWQAAMANWAKG